MSRNFDDENIQKLALRVRRHVINMVNTGNSSHIGSVLSITDILAVLYGKIMKFDPADPEWCDRDRFVLSKGHAGAAVYATLAEVGFFDQELLQQHYQDGSVFSGHVSHKGVPGVEFSTGSLGHGLPFAAGMAFAAKSNKAQHRIFCLLSDGELDEGSNWEAFLFGAHHKLDNLVVLIDRNGLQSMKSTEHTLALEPLKQKFESFGWSAIKCDGHNVTSLCDALLVRNQDTPTVIIAETIKGKGVSFMENAVEWHYRSPQGELFYQALSELEDKDA